MSSISEDTTPLTGVGPMEHTRLYIIRHGQVIGHDELRYNGHSDVDITGTGYEQMERLAEFLSIEHDHEIEAVYSSDLQRAYKGADIIAKRLGLGSEKFHALRELHLGRWEGMTRSEAASEFPEEAGFSYHDLAKDKLLGGESLEDLRKRVMPAIEDIKEKHRGGEVCLVLHGGVNRVILCEAMGLNIENFYRIEQDYGCLNVIDYFHDGNTVVKMLNGGPNQKMEAYPIY